MTSEEMFPLDGADLKFLELYDSAEHGPLTSLASALTHASMLWRREQIVQAGLVPPEFLEVYGDFSRRA